MASRSYARGPRKPGWRRYGRTVHLIDLENLAGAAHREPAAMAQAMATYASVTAPAPDDHVIIGVDRAGAFAAKAAFPRARVVTGAGPDGADDALLAAADVEDLSERFERVCIGSGDHRFLPLVKALRRRGVEVEVIGRGGSIAMELVRAATRVRVAGIEPARMPPRRRRRAA